MQESSVPGALLRGEAVAAFAEDKKPSLAKKFLGSHRFFATVDFSMYVEGFLS